jgi:ubiquinone/menaquinone biosynthesis C-methylase UbiE
MRVFVFGLHVDRLPIQSRHDPRGMHRLRLRSVPVPGLQQEGVLTAPTRTTGRVIHGAFRYDALLWIISRGNERGFREELVELARLVVGESVLDVGCGTGSLAIAVKRRVGPSGSVHAIDPADEMIARARKKARRRKLDITFDTVSAEALPFRDATFDVLLCTAVLHHLPHGLLRRSLAKMRRVLKPGGRILIVDFGGSQDDRRTLHSPHGRNQTGLAPFDLNSVVPRLDDVELQPIETGAIVTKLMRTERLRYVLAENAPA